MINVLSLFDGISCGQVALQRAGIKVGNYYASEIDKHAIKVTQTNFPNTQQLGSVTELVNIDWSGIDLLIGGSPCQGFSFAGKQLNFDDPRSRLFLEYVRILKEIRSSNPNVKFLLENVRMKKEYENIITEMLGVEPIFVNSFLVSAQNRKRLYWTNIDGFIMPEDKGIMLKDIVHENADEKIDENQFLINPDKLLKNTLINPSTTENVTTINPRTENGTQTYQQQRIYDTNGKFPAICVDSSGRFNIVNISSYIVPFDKTLQILDKEIEAGKVGFFNVDSQSRRVYYIHDKAVTLCGDAGGGAAKMGQYLFGCITPDRVDKRQRGQRFSSGNKFYTLTAQDKHGILIEGYIRKLTPIECERLQTLPDNYTKAITDAQRYKGLGNGWTVDVIVEFFKHL